MRERSIPRPLYLAEYNFLRVPFSVVLIFCFQINDISCTQAGSVSMHRLISKQGPSFYLADHNSPASYMCCVNILLCINDISCMQA